MPDVSAALIVLSGTVLIVAGSIPSAMTDTSRQRLAGIGILLAGLGFLAWVISFVATFSHWVK